MTSQPSELFDFGPFRLDVRNATLEQDGRPLALAPKAFSVLLHLVRHAGVLVTREAFLDAVWPGAYVGDAALKVCIRDIRKTLGDTPQIPAYIQTVHRRGYRFIGTVTSAVRPSATAAPIDDNTEDMSPPVTRYARSGDVSIAYQVLGNGPIDLVFVMGWVSHLDYFWREPSFERFLRRLASFTRLILFDKRGTGLSDRVSDMPTLEQRMDDVRAVLEAVGSTRAALLGVSEGGPLCTLFATTYPSRTSALVMIGTYARRLWAPDYPWAQRRTEQSAFLEEIRQHWGGAVGLEVRAPSRASDPVFRQWWATYLRMGASPGAALTLTQMNAEIDVRHVLPAVRVPTLVLHRTEDRCFSVEEGRYIASQIPGATFAELPGADHLPFVGDQDALLDEVERFLGQATSDVDDGRVLATLMHVVVGSSSEVESAPFEAHMRRDIQRFRGRVMSGDVHALTAAFDGPARAIRCASALAAVASQFGCEVRVGLHTGECATTGAQLTGPALDVARALAETSTAGEVLVSRTVKDLVAGSGLTFSDRGVRSLGAREERWRVFAVPIPSRLPSNAIQRPSGDQAG